MPTSIFLAQILGPIMLIIGISFLVKMERYQKLADDLFGSPALGFISGLFTLVVGMLMVLAHNIWSGEWNVVITVISWLILLKGAFFILLPELLHKMAKAFMDYKNLVMLGMIGYLLIGGFLTYMGYMV